MDFRPNYVPKTKKKVNYKIVVPFIVISAFLFYFALDHFLPEKKQDTSYSICNLSGKETMRLMEDRSYPSSIVMKDYAFYGESLGLYHEEAQPNVRDHFSGNTMFLNNLCHDDERAYMMDSELDRKIPLLQLEDGFYEVEILEGLDRHFIFSEDKIHEEFYTVPRNGYTKKLEIIANKELFKNESDELLFDKNYVYLKIETVQAEQEEYDIVIDPARLNEVWDGFVDRGYTRDGQSEADIMYDVAVLLKDKLKEKDLNVKILRTKDEARNLSGKNGRLEEAYNNKAKYYINLSFPSSGSTLDKDTTIIYSSYSSSNLATNIMKSLIKKTDLNPSSWSGPDDMDGVYPSYRDEGLDRSEVVRETGGKVTGAGIKTDNEIGKTSSRGMNSVIIEFGYMTNDHDFKTVTEEKELITDAIAEAIFDYLEI